jgi:hypothetical protein
MRSGTQWKMVCVFIVAAGCSSGDATRGSVDAAATLQDGNPQDSEDAGGQPWRQRCPNIGGTWMPFTGAACDVVTGAGPIVITQKGCGIVATGIWPGYTGQGWVYEQGTFNFGLTAKGQPYSFQCKGSVSTEPEQVHVCCDALAPL